MADHNVELRYGPHGLVAPRKIKIKRNQTIVFSLVPPIPGGTIKITLHDADLFSAAQFKEGDHEVRVVGTPKQTFYKCELFVNGVPKESRDGADGGEMVPDSGT